MWLIGLILGGLAGGALHGLGAAFAGAVIGALLGLLVSRPAGSDSKIAELEKRLLHATKAFEDIHWRLSRLESEAKLPPSPMAARGERNATSAPAVSADARSQPTPETPPRVVPPPLEIPANTAPVLVIQPAVAAPAALRETSAPAVATPIETPVETPLHTQATPAAAAPAPTRTPRVAPAYEVAPPAGEAAPAAPGLLDRLLAGNILAKVGVVILFFGVGFLLKLAYDHGYFPPWIRLVGVALASAAMFAIGWRLKERNLTYASVLMGGAVGLLYLDVFFALKTFEIISGAVGFILFAALGVATLVLSVKLDGRALAVFGLTGAFLAPVLASTNSGNHVMLFSYYLLLNLVIFGASWFKSWRELNLVGFLFTFAISLAWGVKKYVPENFSTVEPFLIAFFLLYLAIPILFAHRQPPKLKGFVDGTLIFGVPLSASMMQAALTKGMPDNILMWSAIAVSAVYATLSYFLWKRENMKLLAEAHLALAIVFGTCAPYFAFKGVPTFAFWTLEAAAIYWIGCRQSRVLARTFALLLQVGAAGYFLFKTLGKSYEHIWLNDFVMGCALIALGALVTSWLMHRFRDAITDVEKSLLAGLLVTWACAWLLAGGTFGIWREWTLGVDRGAALLIYTALWLCVFEIIGMLLDWRTIRRAAAWHIVVMAPVALLWLLHSGAHPLAGAGVIAWPLSFAVYFGLLHRHRSDGLTENAGLRSALAWLLLLLLATWEAGWRFFDKQYAWVWVLGVVGLVAAALRAHFYRKPDGAADSFAALPMMWAIGIWFAGLFGLIDAHVASTHHVALMLAAVAISIGLFEVVGRKINWSALRHSQPLLTIAMLVGAALLWSRGGHPFAESQGLGWLIAFCVSAGVLLVRERDGIDKVAGLQSVLLFDLGIFLLQWEAHHQLALTSAAWRWGAVGVIAASGIAVVVIGHARRLWPFGERGAAFTVGSLVPLVGFTLLWTIGINALSNASAPPLPHLPILNPLDLAQIALLAACAFALKSELVIEENRRPLWIVLAALGFYWINAVLLRAVHHYAGVNFELHALLASTTAQAALSLLWTATAWGLMLLAGRKQSRPIWIAGAFLLGAVVVKLFINDLGNTGTVARVVSFMGVGIMLLVIGYVAPVPPAKKEADTLEGQ